MNELNSKSLTSRGLCVRCAHFNWEYHLTRHMPDHKRDRLFKHEDSLVHQAVNIRLPVSSRSISKRRQVEWFHVQGAPYSGCYLVKGSKSSTWFDIGPLEYIKFFSSSCSFCDLVWRSFHEVGRLPARVKNVQCWFPDPRRRIRQDPYSLEIIVQDEDWKSHYMCGLRFTLLGNESRFFTRPNINPHQINTDLLREWREQCDSEEGERRQPFLQDHSIMNSRDVGGTTLRVIDIETDCVIPAPRDCSYVALSYVWGDVTPIKLTKAALNRGFQEQESPKSARFQLYREELPKTIQDALLAVMLIGKRYLWVDCLCIVQDDEHERMDTIHNMHYIYAAASLTIIAAGGSDANAGLPGLGQGTRNIQPLRASVDGVELVEIDPPLSLESTVWGSRGWTYQEYQFSIRALIFVNERVYFQCIHGCYGETRLTWPFRGPPKINSVDSRLSSLEEFEKYLQHVQEYSKRVLTYEEDVLNAFSAILEDYATRNNTGLCWGLPQDRFSLALMWVNNIESPNRVIPIRRRSQGPNHIHPFPSWSWAGWVGSIHYPMQDSGDSFVHRFESAVVWPWEEGYDVVSESDPNLTGLLSISVRMVILKFEDTEEVERPLLYRFNDGRTWSSGSLECFFLGRIRDDMAARQTNKHIHKSQILLIIEPDESGIYRRKGLMRVSTNFLASALSETRRIILG